MKVDALPQEAIVELQNLVEAGDIDMNSPAVTNSVFYQRIQNESLLMCEELLDPAILLVVCQIVARSSELRIINMSNNNLGSHGPAIAATLANTCTIHTIHLDGNKLGVHGPATAQALAASNIIHTVYMGNNNLGVHGPATAAALATSKVIRTVYMEANNLGAHGPDTATPFISRNNAGQALLKELLRANHEDLELFPVDIMHLIGEYAVHPYIDFTIE